MKPTKSAALEALCAELRPEDGIPSHLLKRQQTKRKETAPDRHQRQYCRAVQRELDGVIDTAAPATGLSLVSVEPVPGSSALLVLVSAPVASAAQITALEQQLQNASGFLRAAVAGVTHRKRVAHLRFRVVPEMS